MLHPVLQTLSACGQDAVSTELRQRTVAAGAFLFHQNTPAEAVYFINSGTFLFSIDGAQGKSTFIGIAKAGDYLGECEILANTPHFAHAIALVNCSVSYLPRATFTHLVTQEPHFAHQLAQGLAKSLRLLQLVQMVRHQLTCEQNLASIVLYLASHFGTAFPDQRIRIDINLPKELLSNIAGLTRQGIHKTLKTWQAKEWIDYRYGNLLINDPLAIAEVLKEEASLLSLLIPMTQ